MNIVYCGSVFDPTGYGVHARSTILPLHQLGVDIKVVNHQLYRMLGKDWVVSPKESAILVELMNKPSKNPCIGIECFTPDIFRNTADYNYNIGVTVVETSLAHPKWVAKMNEKDEIWTNSKFCKNVFEESGVTVPIYVFPIGVNLDLYNPSLAARRAAKSEEKKPFVFLSVFQWQPRKAPEVLLSAYLQEFDVTDNMVLRLRTYRENSSIEERQKIYNRITAIARQLELDHEPAPIEIIYDTIPDEDMPNLYSGCDCFVLCSRGEGFGVPLVEAMAMEKPVIATDYGGPMEIVKGGVNGFLLRPDRIVPCYGMGDNPWYQPPMKWAEPCINTLREFMRCMFRSQEAKDMGKAGRKFVIQKYDQMDIAKKQKEHLEKIWKENF